MFNHKEATARYVPRPGDAPGALFDARLKVCQACPLRLAHTCRAAQQLVTILARPAGGRCPTGHWPDSKKAPPPPRPRPVWNHDSHPVSATTLGPLPAAVPLGPEFPRLDPLPLERHLLCHVYPRTAGQKWRRTAEHLCARKELFNGRRVIAVARDHECDSVADVREAFAPLDAEFLEFDNHPDLGEVATFVPLLAHVADPTPGVLTCYCHAKGSSWPEAHHPAHEWADAMFAACLDYPELIRGLLSSAVFAGAFRRGGRLAATVATWHYSGTFFWFRNDVVFGQGKPWEHVEQTWGGTEAWPSLQIPKAQSACLFLDDAGDLYDPKYWETTVRPALRAWKNSKVRAKPPVNR